MAILIIFMIFGLFWLGITLASVTYMVFKSNKNLTQKLENHSPFWLQDYYAFLNRYHNYLLFGSVTLGIGLTLWGVSFQNHQQIACSLDEKPKDTQITIKRNCQKRINEETTYIERSARPYGGTQDLYHYFDQNQYNTTSQTGTIYVQFFVQKDGSLSNISVLSSISPALDNEAIRLIKEYPKGWQPALYHGKAVQQRLVVPVQF